MRIVHVILAIVLASVMVFTVGVVPDSARAAPGDYLVGVDYPCTRDGLAEAVADSTGEIISFDCNSPHIDFYEGDAITINPDGRRCQFRGEPRQRRQLREGRDSRLGESGSLARFTLAIYTRGPIL